MYNAPIFNCLCPTADGGTDFTLVTTSVTFTATSGNTDTQDVTVSINDDMLVEGLETYELTIAPTAGVATVAAGQGVATVNLADNDGKPAFFCVCVM